MMSVEMKRIHAIAEAYDKTLKATDPRFGGIVIVHSLSDFSSFTFSEAFAMYYDSWYIVFTEHYGFHLYHEEDASVCFFVKRSSIEHLEIEDSNEKK